MMDSTDAMDASYGAEPVKAPEDKAEPESSVDEENAQDADILISKSKLPDGTEVGDTCTFKAVKDFGDEMSLKYVKADSEEKGEAPSAEDMTAQTDSEIAALDKQSV